MSNSKTKKITIENLKERLIRLIHLNPNIRDLILEATKLNIEELTEICHEFENESETIFIGRDDEIKKIEEILANKNSVIISAFAGTGKTRLAKQLGHLYQSKNKVVVRWFNCEKLETFEEEFKRFAKLLLKTEFIGDDLSLVIQKVIIKMKSHKKKFLFIFDNVEQYKEINHNNGNKALYPRSVLLNMPKDKYLVIITSRISSLSDEFETVTIKPFNMIDAKNYLIQNSKENLTELEIQNLFKFFKINNSKENDEILPIKLFLVVKNIKDCLNLNKLLQNKEIVEQKSLEEYLFEGLKKESEDAVNLLSFCAYLDPEMISFNIIENITGKNDSKILKILEKYGLIRINKKKEGIEFHRLIHEELKKYHCKSKNQKAEKIEIVKKLSIILNDCVNYIGSDVIIKNNNSIYDYLQIKKIIDEFDDLKEENNKIINLNLK